MMNLDLRQRAYFIIQEMRLEGYMKGEMVDRVASALRKLDELPSPWEYHLVAIPDDDSMARGCQMHINVMAELGWEPLMPCGSRLIMRRRKAVSDGQETDNAS